MYLVTRKSNNRKVGPIMVTTSQASTCPSACPLRKQGCYADAGPLGMLWAGLSSAKAGQHSIRNGRNDVALYSETELLSAVSSLEAGALWRHNQAGDLAGKGNAISARSLNALVQANAGKRGFTYTHKPVVGTSKQAQRNAALVQAANEAGFTVNLSANNPEHADELAESGVGPVVTVLPADAPERSQTPAGRDVVVCPAVTGKAPNCKACGLCQRQNRRVIVGFPIHGVSSKKAHAATQKG